MYGALVDVMFLLLVRHDRSSTGHILGDPQRIIAERDLSPANVSLLRVILHSAMLAGAYQQPEVKLFMYSRVKKQIRFKNMDLSMPNGSSLDFTLTR